MTDPLISVCLISFNQADFITKSIDSVLMQKVKGTVEIVLADDILPMAQHRLSKSILNNFQIKFEFLKKRITLECTVIGNGRSAQQKGNMWLFWREMIIGPILENYRCRFNY